MPIVLGSGRGQGQKHALPAMQKHDGPGEAKANPKSGKEAKGGEEMKQKITDAEAFEAAKTIHKYCLQYHLNKVCKGCMFITGQKAVMPDCCRLDFPVEEWEFRGAWNRRAAKK